MSETTRPKYRDAIASRRTTGSSKIVEEPDVDVVDVAEAELFPVGSAVTTPVRWAAFAMMLVALLALPFSFASSLTAMAWACAFFVMVRGLPRAIRMIRPGARVSSSGVEVGVRRLSISRVVLNGEVGRSLTVRIVSAGREEVLWSDALEEPESAYARARALAESVARVADVPLEVRLNSEDWQSWSKSSEVRTRWALQRPLRRSRARFPHLYDVEPRRPRGLRGQVDYALFRGLRWDDRGFGYNVRRVRWSDVAEVHAEFLRPALHSLMPTPGVRSEVLVLLHDGTVLRVAGSQSTNARTQAAEVHWLVQELRRHITDHSGTAEVPRELSQIRDLPSIAD